VSHDPSVFSFFHFSAHFAVVVTLAKKKKKKKKKERNRSNSLLANEQGHAASRSSSRRRRRKREEVPLEGQWMQWLRCFCFPDVFFLSFLLPSDPASIDRFCSRAVI
jgi:hypothetical protein